MLFNSVFSAWETRKTISCQRVSALASGRLSQKGADRWCSGPATIHRTVSVQHWHVGARRAANVQPSKFQTSGSCSWRLLTRRGQCAPAYRPHKFADPAWFGTVWVGRCPALKSTQRPIFATIWNVLAPAFARPDWSAEIRQIRPNFQRYRTRELCCIAMPKR